MRNKPLSYMKKTETECIQNVQYQHFLIFVKGFFLEQVKRRFGSICETFIKALQATQTPYNLR